MTTAQNDPHAIQLSKPPLTIQILSVIGYTGFAIPVSIVAMVQFGVLGLALAGFLAWQLTRVAGIGTSARLDAAVKLLKPQTGDALQSSGNKSFDAYRDRLMERLEQEQTNFEGFLDRLRDAKDRTEFDSFLADREARTKADQASAVA